MADTLLMTIKEYTDIKHEYPYWNKDPLIDLLYRKGRQPIIIGVQGVLDTSANTETEISKPANVCVDFASPLQIYIRSSQAADTSLNYYVIGQKADNSFGLFTLTTDATDGTTPVDCGLWNAIYCLTGTGDTATGNIIIDDDGASTTVYFTAALGVNPKTGVFYVPTGYYATCIDTHINITAVPATPATNGMFYGVGLNHVSILPYGQDGNKGLGEGTHRPQIPNEQMKIHSKYAVAVIPSELHAKIVLWEA